MATKKKPLLEAQNPLILLCNRLMEAFAKSDDERDFYLDRQEGFILYIDLDKPLEDLQVVEKELMLHPERYCLFPKLTFYETKKIMEGFIHEKVYDIDTKEKLLDIIQSKEARENFLEFIYDHHSEQEKWQAYYQERSRIRIIEWLRANHFHFVFEEDLDLPSSLLEKLKKELFQTKAGKDILAARKTLVTKSKIYYSNEALNPRPKRGRPPKQVLKTEVERQVSTDIYTTVPAGLLGFLFTPDLSGGTSATFSSKFASEEELYSPKRPSIDAGLASNSLDQKLAALRSISSKWKEPSDTPSASKPLSSLSRPSPSRLKDLDEDFEEDDIVYDEEEDDDEMDFAPSKTSQKNDKNGKTYSLTKAAVKKPLPSTPPKAVAKAAVAKAAVMKGAAKPAPVKTALKPVQKKGNTKSPVFKKAAGGKAVKKGVAAKHSPKKSAPVKSKALRPIKKLKAKKK